MKLKKIVAGIGLTAMAFGVAGVTLPFAESHARVNVGDSIIANTKIVDDDAVAPLDRIPLDD